jgi:hypothetical protein
LIEERYDTLRETRGETHVNRCTVKQEETRAAWRKQ